MTGHCSHCLTSGLVFRYRLWQVGLRYLCPDCFSRLSGMGMDIEPVTDEPRQRDVPVEVDRRVGLVRFIADLRGAA